MLESQAVQTVGPTADVTDRVVIVTGASSGIGAHLARSLARRGALVVGTARRLELLGQVFADLDPQRTLVVPGDLTVEDFPGQLMLAARDRFGRVDALVNNAGASNIVPAEHETTDDFMRILGINLVAVFACAREVFPHMVDAGGGSIVNVSSALGLVGIGRIPMASYCAAKGGVINMTRELAAQWAARGVRVNCIAPGWFRSDMTDGMFDARGLAYIERTVPMGRAGELGELDEIVAFLTSNASSYVTGQNFVVDGGWTII
jgi:NAD(P)-dependent dehydrogenase (short-subunit alcohol dehydrogenase family)